MSYHVGRRSVVTRIAAAGDEPSGERETTEFARHGEKYELLGEIGAGGMGEVVLVHDRDLRREVAMKVMRPEIAARDDMRSKFVIEAQATSQLEHPGIPPVHDIGLTSDGEVYFTMRVVRGKTLQAVLKEVLLGTREARREWNLHKLMSILERVAEAVHFAHEKGIVHRDLKPENIMLGDYGEVHVMDWGIAKVGDTAEVGDETETDAVNVVGTDAAHRTGAGVVKGTIPYMSPEQARGEEVDARSDVYSLGTVLYEALTLNPAYTGDGLQLLSHVQAGDFPSVETRNPRRRVPDDLAALCRDAMTKDVEARLPSGREFAERLRAWLDGRAEGERRRVEADALAMQGREAMEGYVALHAEIGAAESTAEDVEATFQPWQSLSEKAPLTAALRRVRDVRRQAALAFAETTKLLEAAILSDRANATARAALADLWRVRLDEAESGGTAEGAAHALTMVTRYDDGRLASYVAGDGALQLTTDTSGVHVALVELDDRDGLMVPGEERDLGTTPLSSIELPMGSYVCILRRHGRRDVRYPVYITRNRVWHGRVQMFADAQIGDGFVQVAAGPFVFGDGRDRCERTLPDFAIQKYPVTFGDWAEFLAALDAEKGQEAAVECIPRTATDGAYMERLADGSYRVLLDLIGGPVRERYEREYGSDCLLRLPVSAVTFPEAVAYCEWRSRTTGQEWRLPTEEEREKASRGVDGRDFPWGSVADASLGKCRDSRDEDRQPEPVGTFATAASVYGMGDAAGNVFDWTDSWSDARRSTRVLRGGSWNGGIGVLRCALRGALDPRYRYPNVGFRCARSL